MFGDRLLLSKVVENVAVWTSDDEAAASPPPESSLTTEVVTFFKYPVGSEREGIRKDRHQEEVMMGKEGRLRCCVCVCLLLLCSLSHMLIQSVSSRCNETSVLVLSSSCQSQASPCITSSCSFD